MNDISTIVRIDVPENQWTKESGQIDVRPADELADPGPRWRFEPTPGTSAEFALDVSRALIIDVEHDIGDTAQGIGEAQGVGDTAQGVGDTAQGIGEAQDIDATDDITMSIDDSFSFIESGGQHGDACSASDSDGTDAVNECYDELALGCVGKCVLD